MTLYGPICKVCMQAKPLTDDGVCADCIERDEPNKLSIEQAEVVKSIQELHRQQTPLERFIDELRPELRTGGGATLDELWDLAIAVQKTLEELKEKKS